MALDPEKIERMAETAEASPTDVALSLDWRLDSSGMLVGVLRALNTTGRPVRLAGKPGLQPCGGADGGPLGVECFVTAEMRRPGYVDLGPGTEAVTTVYWGGVGRQGRQR